MKDHLKDILILDYLNGGLAEATRLEVRDHLDRCEACRARLGEYRQTWQLLDRLQSPPADSDLVETVLARIGSDKPAGNGRRFLWRWDIRRLGRTAASVAAALLIGHLAGRMSLSPASASIDDATLAQALYLDVLSPSSATGWSQIVLESEQGDSVETGGTQERSL